VPRRAPTFPAWIYPQQPCRQPASAATPELSPDAGPLTRATRPPRWQRLPFPFAKRRSVVSPPCSKKARLLAEAGL